jgi:predicted dienelactone hydrolase
MMDTMNVCARLSILLIAASLVTACGDDTDANNDTNQGAADSGSTDTGADAGSGDTGSGDDASDAGSDARGFEVFEAAEPLFEPGSYEVGYRELSVTYDPPGDIAERALPLKVWYPAAPDSGAEPASYAVGGIVEIQPELALDAPPASDDGPFPVVIYSHGSGGEGLLAYPYGELFASWGWVVAAPNHVGNTALDALGNSSVSFAANMLNRVTDISAVLDALDSGLSDEAVDGLSDMENVFLFGHSFGAYTTLAVGGADIDFDTLEAGCASYGDESCEFLAQAEVEQAFRDGFGDSRVDAIGPQAPALVPLFADGELAAIEVPTMLQTGRIDQTTTQEGQAVPAWNGLDHTDDIWVEMPRGAHFTFITICTDLSPDTLDLFRPDATSDGCGEDFIDTTIAVPTLRAYLLGFAELHVLGDTQWSAVVDQDLVDGFEVSARQ